MLHFAAVVPNIGPYQEFRAKAIEGQWWEAPAFVAQDGVLPVPSAPGLGVTYDPALLREAVVV